MISIFIIDDHKVFIEGITILLKNEFAFDEVKGFVDVDFFFQELKHVSNSDKKVIAIVDINLNRVYDGIDVCKEIKSKYKDIGVIALTLHHEHRFVKRMIEAGCDAYLLKTNAFEEIKNTILKVAKGEKYFTQEVTNSLNRINNLKNLAFGLNPREKKVLEAVVKGMMNTEIAKMLAISVKTVEYYRKGIYMKFGVNNAVELTNEVNKYDFFE